MRDIGRPRGHVAAENPWWVRDRNAMPVEPMWEFIEINGVRERERNIERKR